MSVKTSLATTGLEAWKLIPFQLTILVANCKTEHVAWLFSASSSLDFRIRHQYLLTTFCRGHEEWCAAAHDVSTS